MKTVFSFVLLAVVMVSAAQYRYDGVTFKTVYWDDLCETLKQNPDHLLLDVRSKGEHDDTSALKSLNIGRLQGATNINITELGSRLKEIEAYKNKPVFVYCSHSQRSRRVSKMLADSGFVNVFNVNGGVSNLRMLDFKGGCGLLTSSLPYQVVSPKALAQIKSTEYFILDVRPDSAFRGIAVQERRNALGRFTNAVNIPFNAIELNLASIPKNKKILIADETGGEAAAAAEKLSQKGFSNLAILFNGMDAYITEVPEKERSNWETTVAYHTINGPAFDDLMKKTSATVIDVRSSDEFNNRHKDAFRNIGNIKEAINIPYADWEKHLTSLPADKNQSVVIYSFGNMPEAFEAAEKLSAQGYKNVNVLLGGLFNLRWRAANIKGNAHLKDWVVNVPADNL